MFLARFDLFLRHFAAIILTGTLVVSGWAQTQVAPQTAPQTSEPALPQAPQPVAAQVQAPGIVRDYTKPHSSFPNVLAPYKSAVVPPPNLSNTSRVDQLLHDGKIMLSINDAIALSLENNLDIVLARYNLNIADTDILRAKGGANILGVNTGIVQNTPGGGTGGLSGQVGSGTGGTSVAAGGVGTGTNGLVSSTLGIGAAITSFDPTLTGTLQMDRGFAESTSVFTPVPVVNTNTGTANFSYLQGFHWGTNLSVGFNNTHVTTSNPTSSYTPSLASNFQVRVTQELLQGFGSLSNTRFIRIAKNNREISDVAFRLQIITTVDQVENLYWNLVYAYENVRVQQDALAFAQRTLEDNKKQVQFGTMPPIQVVSAQSVVSTNQQNVILAQTNLELQELLMKNALSRNLEDPTLAGAEVIPISVMQLPPQEPVIPTQNLINDALAHRAELSESRVDLSSREINNKAVRNALLPTLNLYAYYGGSGIGGDVSPAILPPGCLTSAFGKCFTPGTAAPPFSNGGPVGYGGTLDQLVTSVAPDKGLGLTLNIPLRNRVAQADEVRAQLEYRQAQVRLQQLENQVRIEVRNAQFDTQQNRASVDAAQAAVDFQLQTLDADQKKLAVGVGTSTAVLQDESSLTAAESNLVSAKAAYEKSQVEMDRATGLLLDHAGIIMADAERGQVTQMPNVPYVAVRENPQSVMPPSQQPQ
ncbi:MAG TPA: TolC family protein [Terriglobales bacterium]|jgi:outer membrane protein|nr:TolC family protein [Terriglobales bacterium]